jgi:hypothetical protein
MAALSAHAERILAPVSGLPRKERERRQYMVLQAFIDDSVEAGKFLVFAGYVAPVETWLAFSDEWKVALTQAHLPRFKMAEAAQRDPLISGYFYRIIENHLDQLFALGVEIDGLRRAVRELNLSKEFENPYAIIYPMMYDFTLAYRHEIGISEPVDFFFDKHGSRRQVEEGFRYMLSQAQEERRHMMGEPPRFEDDDQFLPLQAADLLAWHVRAQWLKYGTIVGRPLELSWRAKKAMTGLIAELRYDEIKENLEKLIRQRRGGGTEVSISFTGLDGRKF